MPRFLSPRGTVSVRGFLAVRVGTVAATILRAPVRTTPPGRENPRAVLPALPPPHLSVRPRVRRPFRRSPRRCRARRRHGGGRQAEQAEDDGGRGARSVRVEQGTQHGRPDGAGRGQHHRRRRVRAAGRPVQVRGRTRGRTVLLRRRRRVSVRRSVTVPRPALGVNTSDDPTRGGRRGRAKGAIASPRDLFFLYR